MPPRRNTFRIVGPLEGNPSVTSGDRAYIILMNFVVSLNNQSMIWDTLKRRCYNEVSPAGIRSACAPASHSYLTGSRGSSRRSKSDLFVSDLIRLARPFMDRESWSD